MLCPTLVTLHASATGSRTHLYSSTPLTYTTLGVVGSTLTSLVKAPYSLMVVESVHNCQVVPEAVLVRYRPRNLSLLLAISAYLWAGLLADCFRLIRLVELPAGSPPVSSVN